MSRRARVAAACLLLASAVAVGACGATSGGTGGGREIAASNAAGGVHGQTSRATHGLHVSGNVLLDARGRVVRLHGVNRSGTEYSCVHGIGIFDGPSDAQSVRAIASWHVNVVRILLNEECWLGINGVKPQYSGVSYRRAIVRYVRSLHRHGMYAELSLMWAAPGGYQATYQPAAPDADHAPAFWSSLARTFRHDPNVILAPWGETTVDADCFLMGLCGAMFGPANVPYRVAGMQQAVDLMRGAGYTGVISIPGIDYANDLSQWLSREPADPLHQLIAEAHVYGGNTCSTTRCFESTLEPVAHRVPLILGEIGESIDAADCGTSHLSSIMRWADTHGVGYEAWTWDTWGGCDTLIDDYGGKPHGAYGAWIKAHYAARPAELLVPAVRN